LPAKVANALCTLPYRRWRVKVRAPCRGLTAPPSAVKTKTTPLQLAHKMKICCGVFERKAKAKTKNR